MEDSKNLKSIVRLDDIRETRTMILCDLDFLNPMVYINLLLNRATILQHFVVALSTEMCQNGHAVDSRASPLVDLGSTLEATAMTLAQNLLAHQSRCLSVWQRSNSTK